MGVEHSGEATYSRAPALRLSSSKRTLEGCTACGRRERWTTTYRTYRTRGASGHDPYCALLMQHSQPALRAWEPFHARQSCAYCTASRAVHRHAFLTARDFRCSESSIGKRSCLQYAICCCRYSDGMQEWSSLQLQLPPVRSQASARQLQQARHAARRDHADHARLTCRRPDAAPLLSSRTSISSLATPSSTAPHSHCSQWRTRITHARCMYQHAPFDHPR